MRILLTNDDGIYAPGLQILKESLSSLAEIFVVAPESERSICGHAITLRKPIRMNKVADNCYSVDGYPADCVLLGIDYLLKDQKVDLIVSGINRGANLGQDTFYSGTVSAAREGAICGYRSIAISSAIDISGEGPAKKVKYYETASNFLKNFLENNGHKSIAPMSFLNINVPDLPHQDIKGEKITSLGFVEYDKEIRKCTDPQEHDCYWITGSRKAIKNIAQSDCQAVEEGYVSLTTLNLLTRITDK